ncbi:MAG: hypothetical protein PHF49_04415 [Patescibacteria group bacterium]|jgi:hypothetical protein|nr:hypothetical protein [Patescibacteria group bacterium]
MDKNKKNKINQAINFIEELSWLLDNKKNLSLKDSVILLKELIDNENFNQLGLFSDNIRRSNKRVLVGILPELFQDEELFKSTSEMLDFAESVLKLKVSRASKRSRNEYIGWIVCELSNLNDNQMISFVDSLEVIAGNEFKLKQIKEAKKQPNFSWNETISKLGKL